MVISNLFTELTQTHFKVQTFPMHIKRGTVLSLFLCLVRSFSISKFLVWFSTSNLKFGSIFQLFWQEWGAKNDRLISEKWSILHFEKLWKYVKRFVNKNWSYDVFETIWKNKIFVKTIFYDFLDYFFCLSNCYFKWHVYCGVYSWNRIEN